jgi:hypothetical protein
MVIPENATPFMRLKALLTLHGISFVDIARELDLNHVTVRLVLRRHWGQNNEVLGIKTAKILAKTTEIVERLEASNEPEQAAC